VYTGINIIGNHKGLIKITFLYKIALALYMEKNVGDLSASVGCAE
jgi:hypothetical protein